MFRTFDPAGVLTLFDWTTFGVLAFRDVTGLLLELGVPKETFLPGEEVDVLLATTFFLAAGLIRTLLLSCSFFSILFPALSKVI